MGSKALAIRAQLTSRVEQTDKDELSDASFGDVDGVVLQPDLSEDDDSL